MTDPVACGSRWSCMVQDWVSQLLSGAMAVVNHSFGQGHGQGRGDQVLGVALNMWALGKESFER